jgi:hypothetical protein
MYPLETKMGTTYSNDVSFIENLQRKYGKYRIYVHCANGSITNKPSVSRRVNHTHGHSNIVNADVIEDTLPFEIKYLPPFVHNSKVP